MALMCHIEPSLQVFLHAIHLCVTQAQLNGADHERAQQKLASVTQPFYEKGHTKALMHEDTERNEQPAYDSRQLAAADDLLTLAEGLSHDTCGR